jgi:hypothetical protein
MPYGTIWRKLLTRMSREAFGFKVSLGGAEYSY